MSGFVRKRDGGVLFVRRGRRARAFNRNETVQPMHRGVQRCSLLMEVSTGGDCAFKHVKIRMQAMWSFSYIPRKRHRLMKEGSTGGSSWHRNWMEVNFAAHGCSICMDFKRESCATSAYDCRRHFLDQGVRARFVCVDNFKRRGHLTDCL